MTPTEVREAFRALPARPEFPGEREWTDRLLDADEFIARGEIVAADLRSIKGVDGETPDRAEMARRREMFPELWALLFRAFPPDPLA